MIVAATERMQLREATPDDAAFMLELLNEPAWSSFIARHSIATPGQAAGYIAERMTSMYSKLGYGLWIAEILPDHTPAGICGLVKRDSLEVPDLGFAFLREYQGRGYALEAAHAVLRLSAEKLELDKLLAVSAPENVPSIRLLEKLGFEYTSTFTHSGSTEVLRLYAVPLHGDDEDRDRRAPAAPV